MVNIFAPHKSPKAKPPKWLHWAILIFACLAGINAYRAQVSKEPSDLKIENYPEVEEFVGADRWQRIMNPHYDVPQTGENAEKTPAEPVAAPTKIDAPKELEENEPNRQPTKSNQTISDDGGDGESR